MLNGCWMDVECPYALSTNNTIESGVCEKKSPSSTLRTQRPPYPQSAMLGPSVIASAPGCEKSPSCPEHLPRPDNIEKRGSRWKKLSWWKITTGSFFPQTPVRLFLSLALCEVGSVRRGLEGGKAGQPGRRDTWMEGDVQHRSTSIPHPHSTSFSQHPI